MDFDDDDDNDDGRDELFIVIAEEAAAAFQFFDYSQVVWELGKKYIFHFGNTIKRNLHFKVKFPEKRVVTSEVLIAK